MDLDTIGTQGSAVSVRDTDMLIRSTSTLLSLVQPLTGAPKRRRPKQDVAPFLDRFSVIFVSGRRHANVVATVPIFDLDNKKLQVVAMTQDEPVEQEEEEKYGFHVVKNRIHHRGLMWPHQHVTGFAGELQEDEISFFIRRGHDALTFDLHVRHLEWLLNRAYKRDAEPTPNDLERLKQYIYLSCVVKIQQRFDMELSGGRGKFIDFFLGADRKTHRVTFETYEKLPQVEPPHRFPDFKPKWTGETLLASIAKLFRGQLNLDAADPTSIERTTQAGYGVYVCIAIHLRMLHRGLIAITPYVKASPNLRIADPEKKETVKNALDDIDKAQAFLHWALSHSRAFWRTILTMGTHFQDQVDGAAASSASLLSTSGEQAKADESTFAASLVDDSADQLATETNDESDPEGSIDETGDDFDPLDYELPIIRKIRQWFILLTQWHHALSDLRTYLPSLCNDLAAPLEIRARHADHAPDPHRQAGLFETLEFVDPTIDLQTKVTAISAAVSSKSTTNSRALNVLRNLKEDTFEDPKEWQEAFTGGIYCEAQLYQDLKELGIPHAVIGVSRRCCFCCNRLLGEAHPSPATHGRAYPWASPNGLNEETKQTILADLKKHLRTFFIAARARSLESSLETKRLSASEHLPLRKYTEEDDLGQESIWAPTIQRSSNDESDPNVVGRGDAEGWK